jgi:hypothetical protein
VTDEVCRRYIELVAEPGDIVGESLHRVALGRLCALSVSAQVDGHHRVAKGLKFPGLGREKTMVATPSVNEY